LTIIVVNLIAKFYAVAKISQIYCWGILIWATLYIGSSVVEHHRHSARAAMIPRKVSPYIGVDVLSPVHTGDYSRRIRR